jgi:hypothetical protein
VMKIIFRMVLLSFLSSLMVVSCSDHHTLKPETSFSNIFDVADVNSSIMLGTTPYLINPESFQPGFIVKLSNTTEHYILFPFDYGVRLFLYDNEKNQWLEIKNQIHYATIHNKVLVPYGADGADFTFVSFVPDLEKRDYPVDIRVSVLGNFIVGENEIGDEVGAYVDLHLDYQSDNNQNFAKIINAP